MFDRFYILFYIHILVTTLTISVFVGGVPHSFRHVTAFLDIDWSHFASHSNTTITTDTLGQPVPDNETGQLELLGVKLIGKLNSFQAREVTQFEVGDPHWKSDIHYLQTGRS